MQGVIVDDQGVIVDDHWYTDVEDLQDLSWDQPQVGVNYSVNGIDRHQNFNFVK